MARLSQTQESLQSVIAEFSLYTEGFVANIALVGEELDRLRGLADRLRAVGSELLELKASLQAAIGPATAVGAAGTAESERLRRMVERFTIFTHKKAAGAIGSFAVEEGGQAGEVTLF